MSRSNAPDDLDQVFQALRLSGTAAGPLALQELEHRLLAEQARMLRRSGRGKGAGILLGVGLLIAAGGAVSYAAASGWLPLPWVFSVEADGTVTDERGKKVGESYENEDGTTSTVIHVGEDAEYRFRTEESPKGGKTVIFPAPAD